ncbi:MAG: energy transducer TonB [Phenylobacterium sp.]|nr:energy transducer TonB [Phenylobacterium sp.]
MAAIGASIVAHAVAAWGVASLRPVAEPAPQQAMMVQLLPPLPRSAAGGRDRSSAPPKPGRQAAPRQPTGPVATLDDRAAAMASPAEPPPSGAAPGAASAALPQTPRPSAEDRLADYRRRLWAHLAAHAPAAPPGSGTVSVVFGVDPRGALLFARLARSSGRPAFDRAGLASVRAAVPLPPPPDGVDAADLVFTVPIQAAAWGGVG